jgi:hypothetical protein
VNESVSGNGNGSVLAHEHENENHQGEWAMCRAESVSASVDGAEGMKVLVENGNVSVRA